MHPVGGACPAAETTDGGALGQPPGGAAGGRTGLGCVTGRGPRDAGHSAAPPPPRNCPTSSSEGGRPCPSSSSAACSSSGPPPPSSRSTTGRTKRRPSP